MNERSTLSDALRAIDANVILRYLLKDHPDFSERSRRLIESDESVGLTAVALAEVAWTLVGPRTRLDKADVAVQLSVLLSRENVVTVGIDKIEALIALQTCASGTGAAGFGDALIAACARSAGINEIYTFDQQFFGAGITPVIPE